VYGVRVRVTDNGSPALWDEETVTVTVGEVNQAPVISPNPANRANGVGDLVSLPVNASDGDVPANTLTWSASGLPPGLGMNSSTGVISGTIGAGAASGSPYSVTVTVTDNGSPQRNDQATFTWTVTAVAPPNHAPVLGSIGAKSVQRGSLLSFVVSAGDVDSDPLTFSLRNSPAGAVITGGGSFSWTPTVAAGKYQVTVRVSDDGSPVLWDEETFTVTVTDAPAPPPPPPPPPGGETVGLVDPASGLWYLRNGAGAVSSFFFGFPGDVPFVGDWDCDGIDTPGLYRQSDGFVYLRNSNTQGIADVQFFFGEPGDVPVAGDFNDNGCDTVSIYRPGEARFYVINHLGANNGGLGAADYSFLFGNFGDKPVVGDWDGDGVDEVGLHRESTGFFYWRNTLSTGVADGQIFFGDPGDRFVAGDWGIVNGVDTPAVFRPSNLVFYFRHTLTQGTADSQFSWGQSKAGWRPVAGDFGLG
jgi:Putative Ig domain